MSMKWKMSKYSDLMTKFELITRAFATNKSLAEDQFDEIVKLEKPSSASLPTSSAEFNAIVHGIAEPKKPDSASKQSATTKESRTKVARMKANPETTEVSLDSENSYSEPV